ncbi:MAG: ABC transporter substrate-binding protein [Proteobacteria bacterium]|nr:ABC transporter substrate-binding protein [Pseudomonadota bacterium]
MTDNPRLRLALATAIFALTALSSGTAFGADKKTVTVGLSDVPETINALEYKSIVALPVLASINRALMGNMNMKTGQRKLELAESFEILESPNEIKVKLRKGLKFHSGDEFTAHDVQFTVEQIQDPQNTNALAEIFDNIEEIEVLDDYTLIFRFYDPFAPWQEIMVAAICSQKYNERVGTKKFRAHPVGLGPFKFIRRAIGEHIILERDEKNSHYNIDFKILKFMPVKDAITRLSLLETGVLDLIADIQPHHLKRLSMLESIVVKKSSEMPSNFYLAIKPTMFPIMKDINMRMALHYGINREEIVKRVFLGEGYPLYMFANKGEMGYDPNYKIEYDPEKAKQYLKKSSYTSGTPLTLTYTNMVPSGAMVAQVIQHYLKRIGITVKLNQLDWGTYISYCMNMDKRLGEIAIGVWPTAVDPWAKMFMSFKKGGVFCYYSDRPNQVEMDGLVDAQFQEMNSQKRLAIINKIHRINEKDIQQLSLFGVHQIYAMNRRIDYSWIPNTTTFSDLHTIRWLEN